MLLAVVTARADILDQLTGLRVVEKLIVQELERLADTYGDSIYGFCLHLTGRPEYADDLYQDTFLKLYEMRENLHIETNPKSFIMSVALNLYRNYKRKASLRQLKIGKRISMEDNLSDIPSKEPVIEEQIVLKEECALLRREVNKLPDKYKIPVLLFYMEGLSLTEISQILKLPGGTVKTRIHRAKKNLKQKLEDSYYDK